MPSFIESLAAGGKQWGEYAQGVETARTAPQMAQAELAINQGNARLAGQNADLNQYNVDAAGLIKQAFTPVGPSQDYSAIYSQTSSLKQKQDLAKQKLAKAEQLKNATMASGKFSESTRKAYEDAQAESKAVDTEFKTFQAESLRKVLDPALTARDQSSWDMAKPQLAEAAKAAAMEAAVQRGEDPKFVDFIGEKAKQETLSSLPKAWGSSAQNFVRNKAAELKGLETSNKMDEQVRKEEEHKMKMKEYESKIAENYAQRDKAAAEAKAGNPKALADSVKSARADFNTASLARNRFTDNEELTLKTALKVAEDSRTDWFGKPEKEAKYNQVKAEWDTYKAAKAAADKDVTDTENDWQLVRQMAKAGKVALPKETPPPKAIDLSGYQSTPAAQGDTADQVLQGIASVSPGASDADILATAIAAGLITKGTAKVVPTTTEKTQVKVSTSRDLKEISRELQSLEEPPPYVNQDVKDKYKAKRVALLKERAKALGETSPSPLGRAFKY